MKKTLTVLTALSLLTLTLLTGCQKKEESASAEDQIVTIKTMAYGDNSNSEGVSWVRIVNSFEESHPNIKLDYELLYDEAYHQKVVARLASGDVPHLAYMGADARWGAPWKEAGQQYDHRQIIDSTMFDLNLIPAMGPGGEIYEIPLGTSNITTVLYMNEKLVKELGFSRPESYDDIKAMVPAAKAAGLDVVSIDGADGWAWGSCLMSALIARTSGDAAWVSKAVAGEKKFTDKEFVDALSMIEMMITDGVISSKSVMVDYGTNVSNYSNGKALFMIQGQWVAGSIENPEVADNTVMMAWPVMPGEKEATAGSVAAAIQVGYGLTKAGAADPLVKDGAMEFLKVFYSEPETTQRLRDGAIVAPVLKNYTVPTDLPSIVKQKVGLAQSAMNSDVIDAFLSGAPNDALNAGMQKIAAGQASAAEIAAEVESLLR